MKLYIAGPMTGIEDFNYPEFNACEAWIRESTIHEPLNPARLFGGAADKSREQYMRAGLQMLLDADGIIMLNGWDRSPGAKLELQVAEECGLTVGRWSRERGMTLYL